MTQPRNASRFEALLDYLRHSRGFDFTGYKRASLARRIHKRMGEVGIEQYQDYMDYLEVHPDEFEALFNTILINVTSFFRDPETWDFLSEEVIPQIVARTSSSEPIRVWSAGCASGEEAYTLAMLFAEAMANEGFVQRVRIYGTDVDEHALTQARHGIYSARDVEPIPAELRSKYFNPANGSYTFRADLRRGLVFGRHDLVHDAPISHLDLLVCRNTIMYFNAEIQDRILARFHFALNDDGFLFLGKAEMLVSRAYLFVPTDLGHRIFRKVPHTRPGDRVGLLRYIQEPQMPNSSSGQISSLRDEAFDATPQAQIVLDAEDNVALINAQARSLFDLTLHDLGRPFRDLEVSYRPLELRSLVDEVRAEGGPITATDVEYFQPDEESRYLDVVVAPVKGDAFGASGVSITFQNVTRHYQLRQQLRESREDLETAYEELQSTNEELETTNEELQSAVEELQTTNEELQSTNEEMETMNEELQATNEQLCAMNSQLRDRTLELDRTNNFLESILFGVQMGVAVLDTDLEVRLWNRHAEELWGLREEEAIGRSLLELEFGLPVEELAGPWRALVKDRDSPQEVMLESVDRLGRPFICRVVCSLQGDGERRPQEVVCLMERAHREP